MKKYSPDEAWRAEIHTLVDEIDDTYWIRYILQLVHMIWNSMEEVYPTVEEDDDEEDY